MAERIEGIIVQIGGDTNGLDKALQGVNKESTELQRELKKVDRLLKLDPTNTELLEQKQRLLSKSVENTNSKLEALKTIEREAQEQFKAGKISEEQYRALQREIVATEQSLQTLEKRAKSTGTVLIASLENASTKMKDFGGKATSAGKKFLPATAAVSGFGTLATKAAVDFESSFAGVIKTVDATDEELAMLKDGIRDMAKEIPSSANEIATIAESAGQLGIQTPNILSFTRTISDLGVATNLTGEQAATSLAKFANITQMPQENFDRMGSTIVALGNNLATTEADIVSMGMRLAGAGTQVGLTEAEILSFSGALSSVGIEAEAGGSAFSKVMVEMQLAAETGGTKLENFATVAGMSADEFATKFKTNASGALTDFISGLGKAEEQGTSAIKVLDDMGITEVRMRDALLRASSAGDLFTSSIDIGTKSWEENTALTKEAEQRYSTTASQMELAKNAAVDLGISFGELILPIVIELINKLRGVVDWLSNLSPSMKKTIVMIAVMVAAIGPLLMIIGSMSTGIGAVTGAISKLIPFLFGTTESVGLLSKAMAFLAANPIGLAVAAIAAVTAVIVYLWNTNEDFRNAIIEIWNNITSILQSFGEWISNVFKTAWTQSFNFMGNIINTFFQTVSNIWELIKSAFLSIIDFIATVFIFLWEESWNAVANVFKGVFELIVGYAKVPLNAVISMLNAAIDGINLLIKGLNKINFDIPEWVPGLGGKSFGINIPMIGKIPFLAKGGILSKGSAIVGEAGPELLSMINGRAVVQPLSSGGFGKSAGVAVTMHNTFNGYNHAEGVAASRDLVKTIDRALGRSFA